MEHEESTVESNSETASDAVAHTDPPRRTGRLRERVLIALLVASAIAWGADAYQRRALEATAAPLAEAAIQEHLTEGMEAVSKITVAREIPVFGKPLAKIEVFLRHAGGDANSPIAGIEYEYALEDGEWKFTGSGGCTSEECAIRGRAVFETP